MSRSPIFLVLCIVTLGSCILAWRQHRELTDLRAQRPGRDDASQLQQRVQELENLNREQQEQLRVARQAIGESRPAGATAKEKPVRAAPPAESGRSVVQQQTAAIQALMAQPEVQTLMRAQRLALIEQRYAGLFNQLKLSPEQNEKLKSLLEERSTSRQDVLAVAREHGVNPRENPEAFRKLMSDAENQIAKGIMSLIGENGYDQLTGYERTLPQRAVVNQLAERLSYTNTPLNPAQAEQLARILVANPPQRRPATEAAERTANPAQAGTIVRNAMGTVPGVNQLLGVADDAGSPALPAYPITPNVLTQAQAVLSPAQLSALQQLQQQQAAQQQLKSLVTETLVKNHPPSPPARKGGGG